MKAYKIRCYPTHEQELLFAKTEGCCRYVYNLAIKRISLSYEAFRDGNFDKPYSVNDISKQITELKRRPETQFLADVPSDALQQELRDLDRAYQNFFAKRAKYPRKKKKYFGCAIRLAFDHRHVGKARAWLSQALVLPGFGAIRLAQPHRLPSAMPKLITLRRDSAGRFFISFAIEQSVTPLPFVDQAVGVDVNIKHLAVLSDGKKIEGAKALKCRLRYLKMQQRRLSRKTRFSNRWRRQKLRVGRLHARISDARSDTLHKATTQITQRYSTIALEDLNVKGMMANHRLARHLSDQSFGEFRRQIEYKSNWYGRTVIFADRWDATSKTCSWCGYSLPELKLGEREWTCPICESFHDRDINAAQNVLIFANRRVGHTRTHARGGFTNPAIFRQGMLPEPCETRTKPGHGGPRMDRGTI